MLSIVAMPTSGNPLFAEEIAQTLVESGALVGTRGAFRLVQPLASLAPPASVQVVLAARIDRLGEREKNVLQTAAVIGRDFPETLLRRVVELPGDDLSAALRALVQAEFLSRDGALPRGRVHLQASAHAGGGGGLAAARAARTGTRSGGTRARPNPRGEARSARRSARAPLRGGGRSSGGRALASPRGGVDRLATGNGLKDPKAALRVLPSPATIEPTTAEVDKFLRLRLYEIRAAGDLARETGACSTGPRPSTEWWRRCERNWG